MIRSDLTAALLALAAGIDSLAQAVSQIPTQTAALDAEVTRLAKEATEHANEAAALARGSVAGTPAAELANGDDEGTDEPPEATIRRMRDGEGG